MCVNVSIIAETNVCLCVGVSVCLWIYDSLSVCVGMCVTIENWTYTYTEYKIKHYVALEVLLCSLNERRFNFTSNNVTSEME